MQSACEKIQIARREAPHRDFLVHGKPTTGDESRADELGTFPRTWVVPIEAGKRTPEVKNGDRVVRLSEMTAQECDERRILFRGGLQIDEKDAVTLPDYETATLCPYCGQLHRRRPKDTRWVEALPPSEWIENQ